ncbi:metallophosphoesterase [Allopontixanthobacter sp.]|uniref:metallophosphoesterase n=1 Tax=Allopontixanthobacter sp. TaxID=2906452 RepID=UPI002ABA19F8|nr:metallophosphoesterase [Allopontixanthobacter sp.]MDZ4308267.1 metallophosphoesterase [Allopontixanthobacter sp.]
MTDIHIGFDPDAKPEELNRIRFRKTLDRILESPNPIDMLVLSGDLTDHGDRESFEKTAALLSVCPFPVYPMVGNHDTRAELLNAFPDTPTHGGFVHYAVEREGLRILLLDTLEIGRHGGAFCEARRDWLAAELAAHPGTPTLIFMHHPPVVAGVGWMDPGADEAWVRRFGEAVEGHRQILAIHCGHLHRPIHSTFCGIPVSVTSSVAPLVAMDLREIDPDTPDSRALITTEPTTYALHRWENGTLVTHYETVSDWEVLASYGAALQPMIRDMIAERE